MLFDKYLNNWANIRPTNREYLNALKVEIEKQFRAAGYIAAPEGDEDDGDEGEEEEEEGGEEQQEEADEEAP